MGVFVKICGIAHRDDMMEVAAMKPDALGFVLWPDSPRYVKPEDLIRWMPLVGSKILKVGVFVKPDPDEASRIARRAGLDVIQIHGDDPDPKFDLLGLKIWQAVHADRMKITPVGSRVRVDAYVADTYSKELPGGTGKVGNWEAVRRLVKSSRTPVLLAGGLNAVNVREAIRAVQPWGVDVSSGVEEKPGRKNLNNVREFIQQCRTT